MSRIVLGVLWLHVAIYGASFMQRLGEGIASAFLVVNLVAAGGLFFTGIYTFIRRGGL